MSFSIFVTLDFFSKAVLGNVKYIWKIHNYNWISNWVLLTHSVAGLQIVWLCPWLHQSCRWKPGTRHLFQRGPVLMSHLFCSPHYEPYRCQKELKINAANPPDLLFLGPHLIETSFFPGEEPCDGVGKVGLMPLPNAWRPSSSCSPVLVSQIVKLLCLALDYLHWDEPLVTCNLSQSDILVYFLWTHEQCMFHPVRILIPSTNQSTSLKSGSSYLFRQPAGLELVFPCGPPSNN